MKSKKIQNYLIKGVSVLAIGITAIAAFSSIKINENYSTITGLSESVYATDITTAEQIAEYFNEGKTKLYITNQTQLRALATYVNAGNDCKGKEFILLNDIMVSSDQWTPIGNDSWSISNFNGTFNGNGYTISGLTYVQETKMLNPSDSGALCIGLFGCIGENGIVENLTTDEFNIDVSKMINDPSGDYPARTYIGNIVGLNKGTIINCLNNSNITGAIGYGSTGGIAGRTRGDIKNCMNTGNVTGFGEIGGIVGRAEAGYWIEECFNSGEIEGGNDVGGLIGYSIGNVVSSDGENIYDAYVMNCVNTGTVNANVDIGDAEYNWVSDGNNIAGIIGDADQVWIEKVTNKGNITGVDCVGGVLGDATDCHVRDSLNWSSNINCELGDGFAGMVGGVHFLRCANVNVKVNGSSEDMGICSYAYAADYKGTKTSCYDNATSGLLQGTGENWCSVGADDIRAGTNLTMKSVTDFVAPSVQILAKNVENSLTTEDVITYEFIMSEWVNGFTADDITVTNGTKGTLSSYTLNSNGTYSYTMDITTTIPSGSEGTMDVTVEQCTIQKDNEIYNRSVTPLSVTIDKGVGVNITGNATAWTAGDVVLKVESEEEIDSITVNGVKLTSISYTVKQNGDYTFVIIDKQGNKLTKTIRVDKIDKKDPSIKEVVVDNQKITITASDDESGVSGYAVTTTTTEPTQWSSNNIINVENDGTFYVWVKDKVGHISRERITVNTTSIPIYVNGEANGIVKFYTKVENEYKEITDLSDKYLKYGETLRAELEISNYLYTGVKNGKEIKLADELGENGEVINSVSKENYPALTIGKYYFEPISAIATKDNVSTKLVYEFTSTNKKQEEVLNPVIKIDFTKNNNNDNLYVYYSNNYSNFNTGDKISESFSGAINMNIDGIPYVTAVSYVEDKTASERYKEGTEIFIGVISSEKLKSSTAPQIAISFSESGLGKYNHQQYVNKGNAKLVSTQVNENGYTVWKYSYIVQAGDEGIINIAYVSGQITDYAENTVELTTMSSVNENTVYADTTAPTVKVIAKDQQGKEITNNITNIDTIKYTLTFSEEVSGFTADDIIVNGGTKGKLSEVTVNEDGTYTYSIDVTTATKAGNVGQVQLIIENGVCKDLIGLDNVRIENVIIVDKKAPDFVRLEISSNYKEAYKTGDSITIIAKFDENIESSKEIPELKLSFSESGTPKGTLSEGVKSGNTIIWKYEISREDLGELSIKQLTGTVTDLVGNSASINEKNFEEYGIIADNVAPEATIEYITDENKNVTAKISFNEEVIITNNAGKDSYVFVKNGEFTFEFMDLAGNTGIKKVVVTNIDKKAPEATLKYTINKDGTVTAKITSFSEENVTIINNEGKDSYVFTKNGEFTFEFKDLAGNIGTITAKVDNIDDTVDTENKGDKEDSEEMAEIVFEDLTTVQVNGIKHVKVQVGMTKEEIVAKMDKEALKGKTPTFNNLTSNGKLKTGTEISIDGVTKYTVVVKGDVNGDGNVTFIGDVISANNLRIGQVKLNEIQKLAADINNNGTIDFIQDIIAINNYRLGIIKSL